MLKKKILDSFLSLFPFRQLRNSNGKDDLVLRDSRKIFACPLISCQSFGAF